MTALADGTGWIDEIAFAPAGPPWLAMGLSRIDDADWLLPDARRDLELAERARLVAGRRDEVFAALPGTETASAEVLDLVLEWEHNRLPQASERPIDPAEHPLVSAGLRVQEDLALMVPHAHGHHLDAAILCFPSHWRLRDKVGGSAQAIHGPVPGYQAELASKVDRFLERLRPGVVVARRNWTVHDTPDLFAPDPTPDPQPVDAAAVGSALWLRSERQTLRLLPSSGSVLFTIRVRQAPLGALVDHPAAAAALSGRVRAQPDALTRMNGLAPHRDVVLAWLDRIATA